MRNYSHLRGVQVLQTPAINKSTGFTEAEREQLGLRGLLPAAVLNQTMQQRRVMENIHRQPDDIGRYVAIMALQDRNAQLFYQTLSDNIVELMPIVYTPTVGQACREFAHIFRGPKGFYVTPKDRGQVRDILRNWPEDDVKIVVVTDGERILGLGDLGANGMGIPIGKLALYVACAGIHPDQCLPVMLDVGTNNVQIREDPLYLGIRSPRLTGNAYFELVDEFIAAIQDRYPKALIQFEDFLTPNAYALLNRYRENVLCFNDDIQGTAAVALAGVYASLKLSGVKFTDLRIMFLGAGSAATGIADLMVQAFCAEGMTLQQARERLWFVDVDGLVVADRDDLLQHNLPYAHPHRPMSFVDAIQDIKPQVLIGATGAPNTFTPNVIGLMAELNTRPTIFALSNPTSKAECTAEQAYGWSGGQAIFASGSPFAEVTFNGNLLRPGQGNNAYVFPGVGLGAIIAEAQYISDSMFLSAAKSLADQVTEEDLAYGSIYPPMTKIRQVSIAMAAAVAEQAYRENIARAPRPNDIHESIAAYEYDPSY